MTGVTDDICAHLEFLGYEVVRKESGSIAARHQTHFNAVFKQYGYGFLFTTFFGLNSEGLMRKEQVVARCNAFNAKARVCRVYLDADSDVLIEAVFPVFYDRALFGVFIETFNGDHRLLGDEAVKLNEFLS